MKLSLGMAPKENSIKKLNLTRIQKVQKTGMKRPCSNDTDEGTYYIIVQYMYVNKL